MRFTSSPGSTTSASRVTGSPMIEQLHCNIPTGMVIWINPSVAALRTGRPLLMKGSIPSEMKGYAACAAWPGPLFDKLPFDRLPFASSRLTNTFELDSAVFLCSEFSVLSVNSVLAFFSQPKDHTNYLRNTTLDWLLLN